MKQKLIKNISYWMSVIIIGIILGISIQFAKAWTEPTLTPPNGNVGAPINTGTNTQYKSGSLGVGGTFASYSGIYGRGGSGGVAIFGSNTADGIGIYGESTNGGTGIQGTGKYGIKGSANQESGVGIAGYGNSVGHLGTGVYSIGGGTSSAGGYDFYGDGPKSYFKGNVGIGTTTPSAKLTIGGTPGVDGIKFPDGTVQTTATSSGTFIMTATGIADSQNTTQITYTLNGNVVTLLLRRFGGRTSNSDSFTYTGLPSFLTPVDYYSAVILVTDNNVDVLGMARLEGTTIKFYKGAYGKFTTTGYKGLPLGSSITYSLK